MKHHLPRREFIKKMAVTAGAVATMPLLPSCASPREREGTGKMISGPFQPTWESLAKNYQCPEWFRDAKFGIWAHWSAQCVPEQGDWYARQMYIQGHYQYEHHLKNCGHPTQTGFMEIDHLWKAENWQPEELMKRYVRAGAKYFVALANHHDNFDNYDSTHHAWNSVNVGPKRDLIGTWARVARKHGLRFGVTNHSAHSWHWFQTAYGYDGEGELAGQRYDAFKLTKADGKGKWWEGLDPQELYTGPNMVMPDGLTTAQAVRAWHDKNDRVWNENPPPMNPKFVESWFLRCRDLVDKYHPDLLYFDNTELPLGQAGLDITAHYYNASLKRHGKVEAVVTGKKLALEHRPALVEDYERGFAEDIKPQAWQTDTCIGQWHYDRSIFENHRYKSVGQVVRMLVDIVSKNGNLLLNIPVKGDGTIDSDEVKFLDGLAAWMELNGEGIFGSRPWKTFGEGPTKISGGMFNENKMKLGAQDIRFTAKDDALYIYVLGMPEGDITIKSLGLNAELGKKVAKIDLLGSNDRIDWNQNADALTITTLLKATGRDTLTFRARFS